MKKLHEIERVLNVGEVGWRTRYTQFSKLMMAQDFSQLVQVAPLFGRATDSPQVGLRGRLDRCRSGRGG